MYRFDQINERLNRFMVHLKKLTLVAEGHNIMAKRFVTCISFDSSFSTL